MRVFEKNLRGFHFCSSTLYIHIYIYTYIVQIKTTFFLDPLPPLPNRTNHENVPINCIFFISKNRQKTSKNRPDNLFLVFVKKIKIVLIFSIVNLINPVVSFRSNNSLIPRSVITLIPVSLNSMHSPPSPLSYCQNHVKVKMAHSSHRAPLNYPIFWHTKMYIPSFSNITVVQTILPLKNVARQIYLYFFSNFWSKLKKTV